MKKVLVFGTFDILHKGHEYFLRRAKKFGDYLIVAVVRDRNVERQKGYLPAHNEKIRLKNVKKIKIVDKAILGEKKIRYDLIKRIRPDVICVGYDQKPDLKDARKILKKIGMEKIILKKMKPYKPDIYKSKKLNKLS